MGGIINKAESSVQAYSEAEEKEQIQLGYRDFQMSQYREDNYTLADALANSGLKNATVTGNGPWTIKVGKRIYKLAANGSEIETFDEEEWNQTATPEEIFLWNPSNPTMIVGYNLDYIMANLEALQQTLTNADGKIKIKIPSKCTEINQNILATATNINYDDPRVQNYMYLLKSIEEVEIPDSVTCIGDFAFCNCSSLKKIIIPNSVTCIGDSSFINCESLNNT